MDLTTPDYFSSQPTQKSETFRGLYKRRMTFVCETKTIPNTLYSLFYPYGLYKCCRPIYYASGQLWLRSQLCTGYSFWLNKLNQFNGNFIQAEMVKAFISSLEYRQRFGP